MKKRLPVVLAIAALMAGSCGVARANIREVTVVNATPSCADVTAFEQVGNGRQALVQGHNPRTLRSHAEFALPTSGQSNLNVTVMRVRVQIKANADCTGASIEELDQSERAARPSAEYIEAAIFKAKIGYRLRFLAK